MENQLLDLEQIEQYLLQGIAFHEAGNISKAAEFYKEILHIQPDQPHANHQLAITLLESAQAEESLPFFKTALEALPQNSQFWISYISALIVTKHIKQANEVMSYALDAGLAGDEVDRLQQQLSRLSQNVYSQILPAPSVVQALIDLFSQAHYSTLETKLTTLLVQYPEWLDGWRMLSDTYLVQGKDAAKPAAKALQLNYADAKEHCYYGLVLKAKHHLAEAAKAFEMAVQLSPEYAAAYNNLGIVNKDMGNVQLGIEHFRRALALNPQYASCYSNLLFTLSHSDQIDANTLYEEHCRFAQQYEQSLKPKWPAHNNIREISRVLRIGFVSADFRAHSIAYFIAPLLAHLSQSTQLSLYAYSNNTIADEMTQQLRACFQQWVVVDTWTDAQLVQKIAEDAIDILIDLSGHTAGNRLLSFAMKPAPIQVSWLGYLNTTGLKAMDYYLGDTYLLPPHQFDHQFTEKLVQLYANAPFMPVANAPDVNALPALKKGYITFACFNRPSKITQASVMRWSALLQLLPNSRLLLGDMPEHASSHNYLQWFKEEGIDISRLSFYSRSEMKNYLQRHQEVDICLDTFPSSGVTTSFHALWMGVPTLCFEGSSMTSRGAMALMLHIGMTEFVAKNYQDYQEKAQYWSSNLHELAQVRSQLRQKFNQSILADSKILAQHLEMTLRQMWKIWCANKPAKSFSMIFNSKH